MFITYVKVAQKCIVECIWQPCVCQARSARASGASAVAAWATRRWGPWWDASPSSQRAPKPCPCSRSLCGWASPYRTACWQVQACACVFTCAPLLHPHWQPAWVDVACVFCTFSVWLSSFLDLISFKLCYFDRNKFQSQYFKLFDFQQFLWWRKFKKYIRKSVYFSLWVIECVTFL